MVLSLFTLLLLLATTVVRAELILYNDFEDGWGNFTRGGGDVRRSSSDSRFAYAGTYAIRLRDNSGIQSSMYTNDFDVSRYTEISVAFGFYGASMEPNENFVLESSIDSGDSWTIEADYVFGVNDNVKNNQFDADLVRWSLPAGATAMRIRFRCDASGNGDRVYIDEVAVEGFSDNNNNPTIPPTVSPTASTNSPSNRPTSRPTIPPTVSPTDGTNSPSTRPTSRPTFNNPTTQPISPTLQPISPTNSPTDPPTDPPVQGNAWINEFHYDNRGANNFEFIEVAYTSSVNIESYSVVLYDGDSGTMYNTISVPVGTSIESGIISLSVMSGFEMQNGPDGMALVDGNGLVIEFLSYEGRFEAVDGPAAGTMSTDIGVSESGSTEAGKSLQRWDVGCKGSDFSWWEPDTSTPGALYDPWMTISGCPTPAPAPTISPAPTPVPAPTSNNNIKVMTYNIYQGGITDSGWKDIVKAENADIIVFTEVGNWWENGDELLNQYLNEFNSHFAANETPYEGSTVQGFSFPNTANSIMTRFPIVQEWQLTDAVLSSFSAHDVMVWKLDVGNNKYVYVFGIHLKCCGGTNEDERRNQTIRYLIQWIDVNTNPNDGIMLMGDFNSVSPVDTDPSYPGYQSGFQPSSDSNLNDGPLRMLLDSNNDETYASNVHTFKDAFREANPTCNTNTSCCADTLCDSGLSDSCPERGYTYVADYHSVDSRIDFIIVNQSVQVTGPATVGDVGGSTVCTTSDHLPVDALVSF